jgi:DNA-binding response OmpR family regulator
VIEAWPTRRRRRLLFVDDQPDVARTLAGLLDNAKVDFSFAEDGEAAFHRLQHETFDLVIVDLRMPPGTWGGLWLLQTLAQHGLKSDAVVLSGEAGQAETIEALRLGARDFVVKEHAATELAARVDEALGHAARLRLDYAVDELPAPVAVPFGRLVMQLDEVGKIRAGLAAGEAALRFAALAALAHHRKLLDLNQDHLLDRLAQPSMGTWNMVCRQAGQQVLPGTLRRWVTALIGKAADSAVATRNDVAHGAEPSPSWTHERLPALLDWLDMFLLTARSLQPLELLVPGKMEFTQSGFNIDLACLVGSRTTATPQRRQLSTPLIAGHVHLAVADAPPLDMWPLVLAQPGNAAGAWQVSMWDGIRRARREPILADDPLRYAEIGRSERVTSSELRVADLFQA